MAPPTPYTYHCLCSQLLLASTQQLDSLLHRQGESLDKALILPLSRLPDDAVSSEKEYYATLLNTTTNRKPVVIRRSDGFETRHQIHCGRCKLIVGYQLDHEQYAAAADSSKTGRREDVCYLLPGSLVPTEKMATA
jgi:hypothetical protein